ncbi:ABC transporter substrate-binding protein [Agreia sp. PsM10]|uniref:ABC transporter substrate-binding protein n=1 Tax=Agreia sp. PsM10 TaxID=3030533 RepID=UPI00263B75F6|nr:ABC transporter substrate-binding protein [Agreia sp. PsM10]MDN4641046.1 ABC transporter substrate-binding protein [Agreia sp. PsM10]
MSFTRTAATVGLVAAASLVLAGCSAGGGGSDTIKFAVAGPMSGENAVYGETQVNGIQLAVDEINADGGIDGKQVELEMFDDECDPTTAANVASRIVSDGGFEAVLGHVCSSATLAADPVYERAGLSLISGSSTSPAVSQQGFTNFSRTIPTDDIQGAQMIDFAAEELGKSKIAIVYASDDYGQGLYEAAVDQAEEAGVDIVSAETFVPNETKDFSSILTKTSASDPDVLLLFGYYNDMGTLVTQISGSLASVDKVASAGTAQPDYVSLGGAAAEGTYLLAFYDPSSPFPANEKYVAAYEKAYGGEEPNEQAAYWYEVPYIVKSAIEDHGGTKETLTEAIHATTYEGPTGKTAFEDDGDVTGKTGVVARVTDGVITLDPELTTKFAQ